MSSASSDRVMSTAEYAAHRGCSDSYIRRMRRDGKLVLHADGKRILVAQSNALLDDITDPIRGGDRTSGSLPAEPTHQVDGAAQPASAGTKISTQEAVRRERLARARTAELELGERSGELTRTVDVERAVVTLARQALNSMLNMPSRLRAKLAAEGDPRKVEEILMEEVRQIAESMRKTAEKLVPNQGGTDV